LKLPQLNSVQKSLLIPAGTTFILGGLFGLGGFTAGSLATLVVSPAIYWKGADKEKAKWKRVLTASVLSGSGMLLSVIAGGIGASTVLSVIRPEAYKQYQADLADNKAQPQKKKEETKVDTTDWRTKVSSAETTTEKKSQEQVAAAPPVEQVKATFTATKYLIDAKPEVTQGPAILDRNAKTVEWYTEVKDGGYAGYKYFSRCSADGKYWEKDEYSGGVWKQDSDVRCNISASAENTPRQFKVVASDGFLSQTVQISTSTATRPKVAATPVRTLPDKTTVTVQCKELAKARTATGKINWNALGTGDPRWYAPAATIMLSGKTKNKYGTTVPFTVECRGNSNGSVKLVEVTQ
jgi:hypothetical protein